MTAGGGYAPDAEYIKQQFNIPNRAIESGEYLRPLKHRELVADMVAMAALDRARKRDLPRAIRYLEHCIQVFPQSGGINDVLGSVYMKYAGGLAGDEAEKMHKKGVFHKRKAKEVGFTRLPMDEYAKKLKAMSEDAKGGK